jgi:hypothetical protein
MPKIKTVKQDYIRDDESVLLALRLIRTEMEELSSQVKKVATALDGIRLIALGYVKNLDPKS